LRKESGEFGKRRSFRAVKGEGMGEGGEGKEKAGGEQEGEENLDVSGEEGDGGDESGARIL